MLIFWCCHLQVDEEVAARTANEATPTLQKIFSQFVSCWINIFPSKPDKNLTCTVEELGQFKSFRQNSSNSSLSSSLEKILSISWNDVVSRHDNSAQDKDLNHQWKYNSWIFNVNIASILWPKQRHLLTLKVWGRLLNYKINLWYKQQTAHFKCFKNLIHIYRYI